MPDPQQQSASQIPPPPPGFVPETATAGTGQGASPPPPPQPDYGNVKPIEPGNIQWYGRQKVSMPGPQGQYGTVYSESREQDGKEVLYPRIYDGSLHSSDDSWNHYLQTGQHMGKFKNSQDADAFGQKYHEDAAAGKYDSPPPPPGFVPEGQDQSSLSQRMSAGGMPSDAKISPPQQQVTMGPGGAPWSPTPSSGDKTLAEMWNPSQGYREEHPILSKLGDLGHRAQDFGNIVGTMSMLTPEGAAESPAGEGLLEGAGKVLGSAADSVEALPGRAWDGLKNTIGRVMRDPETNKIRPIRDMALDWAMPDNPEAVMNQSGAEQSAVVERQQKLDTLRDRMNQRLAKAQEEAGQENIERRNSPFEQKAQDLMRRGKEQDALDTKQARLADRIAGRKSLFNLESGTSSAKPSFDAELPAAAQSQSTSTGAPVKLVDRIEAAQQAPKSKIVGPDSPPPPRKVTYQDYNGPELQVLMDNGDVNAMREFIRNPRPKAHLPANAKYLLEEAPNIPWRNKEK